ncbi:MAG TPA: methyltransferase domain-containing protein [Anaerolineae bacterium]|nr:methyltransferase domain-containing protein [Anaerolineae bacterium]
MTEFTVTATSNLAATDWERLWAPYDEATYRQTLNWIGADDAVLDVGAGDLRLACRMARKARHVYAIELNPALATTAVQTLPAGNLTVIWGDAYRVPFPAGITVAVLLMRHCRAFHELLNKLMGIGCRYLITNARWRLAVELIDLQSAPTPYAAVELGWYACRCGATGFVSGPAQRLTPHIESAVHEVVACPAC